MEEKALCVGNHVLKTTDRGLGTLILDVEDWSRGHQMWADCISHPCCKARPLLQTLKCVCLSLFFWDGMQKQHMSAATMSKIFLISLSHTHTLTHTDPQTQILDSAPSADADTLIFLLLIF